MAHVVSGLGAVYVTGWCRLRRRKPKAVRPWRLALYLCGLAAIILALLRLANPSRGPLGAPEKPPHALGRLLARGALRFHRDYPYQRLRDLK